MLTQTISDAQIEFKRGQNDVITTLPLSDGQLLIGFQSNGKAALYIDATINNEVVRFTVGSSSTDYSSQISALDGRISALENSIEASDATLLAITEEEVEQEGEGNNE